MPKHTPNSLSLVADIGGTNTRVALAKGTQVLAETVTRYPNSAYAGLDSVIQKFISEQGDVDCQAACVAVAGPVSENVGRLTNLDWAIDLETLARATRAETTAIINDLQAQGHALDRLNTDDVRTIIPARTTPKPNSGRLVIGVGTGFNATAVHVVGQTILAAPSECGHVNLPLLDKDDLSLAQHIEKEHGFAAVEDVLSGRGLQTVYNWACGRAGISPTLTGPQILDAAAAKNDKVAMTTVATFVKMLGTVAGNLALTHLPYGGLYFVGGMARAMVPFLAENNFDAAFHNKGRFSDCLRDVPVQIVEDDYAALTGCACYLAGR